MKIGSSLSFKLLGSNLQISSQMTLASIASGAEGVMIEVHDNPSKALSDGPQALKPEKFNKLLNKINKLEKVVREL